MATLSASQSADAPRAVAEIANFPPAKVPVAPVLSLASFRDGSRGPRPLSVLDTGVARYTTSGRTAIALALKLMGVGAGVYLGTCLILGVDVVEHLIPRKRATT